VVQPVAVVAGVAVGACGVAAELADGQVLPAAAADEAGRLPQGHVTMSHSSSFIFHLSSFIFHLSFFILIEPALMTVVVIVGTEADVQPAATASVMLQDELVEVQMVDHPVVPLAPRVQVGDMDVGSTTIEVLRVAYAMYRLVQCFTTVATIDMDGMADMVA